MSTTSEERQLENLWKSGSIRVFISHVNQFKKCAMKIKDALADFGVASFVAHNDIEPTGEWQAAIIQALTSMDIFIALLTEGYKESDWTDQEVGFALARKVPILPVSRGLIPYGFIGKYQTLKWTKSDAYPVAKQTIEMAIMSDDLNSLAKDAFITAVSNANSWGRASKLSNLLPEIESLTPAQEERFVNTYNSNNQAHQAFGFQNQISIELERMTGNFYLMDVYGRVSQQPPVP